MQVLRIYDILLAITMQYPAVFSSTCIYEKKHHN